MGNLVYSSQKKDSSKKNTKVKPFFIFVAIVYFIGYSISNYIEEKKEEHRIENESHIEPFLKDKDYAGAEDFLLENPKYLKTTCVDILFTEALSNKKEQVIIEMLERTSKNGNISSSKVYDKALLAYARKGQYKRIIDLFDEYGLKKKIVMNTVDEALKSKQYKTLLEVLEYVKATDIEYLPKNFSDILDDSLKNKKYSECQKLIVGTNLEDIYAREIVRTMAKNGNRSEAEKYIKSNKQYFIENHSEEFYNLLIQDAETR